MRNNEEKKEEEEEETGKEGRARSLNINYSRGGGGGGAFRSGRADIINESDKTRRDVAGIVAIRIRSLIIRHDSAVRTLNVYYEMEHATEETIKRNRTFVRTDLRRKIASQRRKGSRQKFIKGTVGFGTLFSNGPLTGSSRGTQIIQTEGPSLVSRENEGTTWPVRRSDSPPPPCTPTFLYFSSRSPFSLLARRTPGERAHAPANNHEGRPRKDCPFRRRFPPRIGSTRRRGEAQARTSALFRMWIARRCMHAPMATLTASRPTR